MTLPPHKLAVVICMQAHQSTFLWGEPGSTKTKSLLALTEALGEPIWTVVLSIRGPWEQGGIPVIRPDGSVFLAPPSWARELVDAGHGVVFLDELNVAPPSTQNSALRVVDEGQAGDEVLPADTSFIAAGNPPATNVGVYDLTAAMANRLVHIEWPKDHAGWVAGMKNGWATPVVPRLPANWRAGIRAMRAVVAEFIDLRADLLHDKPSDPGEAGQAWPSHRTWDFVATLATAGASIGHPVGSEVGKILVAGCVGEAAANEFRSWLKNLDLRDAEEYLANPKIPLPVRQDQLYATLASVGAAALSPDFPGPVRIRRYYAAWKLMGRVTDAGKIDLTIPASVTLASALGEEWLLPVNDALPPEMDKVGDVLVAAGIHYGSRSR